MSKFLWFVYVIFKIIIFTILANSFYQYFTNKMRLIKINKFIDIII